ncbi:hypothetical protein C1645_775173 [Glomus cerebriforme]|uniref:HTH myb-type domain-containing protein n=1 Tax=Glomus cerebriforme TaxID=658196 RepID=A0A397SRI5_9GLOM|nr:hypothetical protein C1645_775173 [Glomus cerebriforme]
MKMKFGKFRSRNDLKNIWNIRKRQLQRINKTAEGKVVFSPFGAEHETGPFVKYSIQFLLNDDKNVENFENNDVGLVLPEMKKSNETLFSEEIDDKIIELMKEWGHLSSPYAKINEIIPEYTSKQIRRRWINKLNPELCPDPLNEEEKEFIIQGINNQLKLNPEDDKISWKDMISEMKIKFDKLHSENKVKNFWYANKKKRSLSK